MKLLSTKLKAAVQLAFILSLSLNTLAQSTSPNGANDDDENTGIFNASFTSTPILISGTALSVGAKYKFLDVAAGTRAVVTIVSATGGAAVTILDDNNLTKPEAFSPRILVPANSNGLVEFKIEFFQGNTSNNYKVIDSLSATAMDIDGSGLLREVDALDMGTGSLLSYLTSTLQISVVQLGNRFTATNIGGVEYTGVDTAAKQVMFTVRRANVSYFTYKAGANNGTNGAAERQKGIYFKGFNYTAGPLPVKYLSFTGNAINKAVVLNWATAQEINHNYFEIERSFTGRDFTSIGLALDGFENGTKKEYAFKDNSALLDDREIVYYRLKQFDNDGKFTYSTILVVRIKSISKVDIQVSPNPFTERITVRFTGTENTTADIRIVNLSGKIMMAKKANVSKGYNNIQIEGLNNLSGGTYLATISVDGKVIGSQKIVK